MSRNVVICCDGTNNEFGECNTSVVRLVASLDDAPASQVVYYDPGIGTLPDPRLISRAGQRASEALDLAFATRLLDKVGNAYRFLMDRWEPGDRLYLLGFSRGAYTARVLGGMIAQLGILPPRAEHLVPHAIRLFESLQKERRRRRGRSSYFDLCDEFRVTFAQAVPGRADHRPTVEFLGLWDTVSSVGWVLNPRRFPYTMANPIVRVARQALALDERRAFYRQNRIAPAKGAGQDVRERWFAGVHSDVGGGYPEGDGHVWRAPFEWILGEAISAGIRVDADGLKRVRGRTPQTRPHWEDPLHESLTPA